MAKMKEIYPLTIVCDRYGGTYSGGRYLAFNLDYDEIPSAISGDDTSCYEYWQENDIVVGKGESIESAYRDLKNRIKEIGE